jgi:hypothetical protein
MFGIFERYRALRKQAEADADALIEGFGEGACREARWRWREDRQGMVIDDARAERHWDRVRRIIGRKIGRDGLDTATRYLGRK